MFLYGDVIIAFLFLVLGVMFLFVRKKYINIISGLGIIYLSFVLGFPTIMLLIVGAVVAMVSFSYITQKRYAAVLLGVLIIPLLLLSAPIVSAAKDDAPGQLKKIDEVDKVKHVEKVDVVQKIVAQPHAEVLGTDYAPFDDGKLQAYLSIGENPIDSASCFISVLYPNMTYFLENQFMFPVSLPYFEGLYYRDFTVPNVTGVYPVNAHCFYNATTIHYHVDNVVLSEIKLYKEGDPIDGLNNIDGMLYTLEGDGVCNDIYCSVNFTIPLAAGWRSELLYSGNLFITFESDEDDDDFEWYAYSPTSGVKVPLFNHTSPKDVVITEQISLGGDLNGTGVFDLDTEVIIMLDVYDWDDKKLWLDEIEIILVYNGSYVQDLRGNDELVVSDGLSSIINIINNPVDEPVIDNFSLFSILWLLVALALLIFGLYAWAGLSFIVWAVLFFINIYISLIVIFIGLLLLFARKKN